MSKHEGRIAVITGGGSGIGQAIALRLAREGARVVVIDINDSKETLELIEGLGFKASAFICDISDSDRFKKTAEDIRQQVGDPDILIHCAAAQFMKPLCELTTEDWRRTQGVNVDGAFHLVRDFLGGMRNKGWGRIVMISSSSFFSPPPGMSHYISSKGALLGFVRGMASELGVDGITVNALAPGLTRTKNAVAAVPQAHFDFVLSRQAIKRSGEPEDQAAAVSFIVSDEAGFMTGQTLLVDGGEGNL